MSCTAGELAKFLGTTIVGDGQLAPVSYTHLEPRAMGGFSRDGVERLRWCYVTAIFLSVATS